MMIVGAHAMISLTLLTATVDAGWSISQNWPLISVMDMDALSDLSSMFLFSVGKVFLLVPMYAAILVLTRRTFNKIYYSDETKTFYGMIYNWYLKKELVEFKAGQATQIKADPSPMAFLKPTLSIQGKKYIAYPHNYKSPMHYNLMMGNIKEEGTESKGS